MNTRRSQPVSSPIPLPIRRRSEPQSLALLVDVVLARYGILPLDAERRPQPAAQKAVTGRREQSLLFPVS